MNEKISTYTLFKFSAFEKILYLYEVSKISSVVNLT